MAKQKQIRTNQRFSRLTTTIFSFVMVVLFLSLAAPVFAQLDTGIEYGTVTGLGTQDIRISIMKIVRVILGLVGIIAIIITLYGGWVWMTSSGNPEKIDRAKRVLRNALIGVIIILSAFSIVSFIIGSLESALDGGGGGGGGPPPACENCSNLGTGIIETVYPVPFAQDVARNVDIMVTFKVEMDPATIIQGCSAFPCSGDLISDNVLIFPSDEGESAKLDDSAVVANTSDGRTFVFNPIDFLGNSISNVWYAVKLTRDIEKDNGQTAFPGAGGYFLWRFEIGTFFDLDPVEISTVFPPPDNLGDNYSQTPAAQAQGSILILQLPEFELAASVEAPIASPGSPPATVSGNYNDSFDGTITVSIISDPILGLVANVFWSSGNINNKPTTPITANTVNLGGGLTLLLDPTYTAGNQWTIEVSPAQTADTLRIDNKIYTFVAAGATGDEINVVTSVIDMASDIASRINADGLAISASVVGATVDLTAVVAGIAGNSLIVLASNGWSTIDPMQDGSNAQLLASTNDAPDQPRNALIVLDFNEAVNPLYVNTDNIQIEYERDPSAGTWTEVEGKLFVSNQFKTVEFLADNDCLDGFGNPITNSCGVTLQCLPTIDPDPYVATHYRVTVTAGLLAICSGPTDCNDPNFNVCSDTLGTDPGSACQGVFDSVEVFYPESRSVPNGIIDTASNSFNGNSDIYVFNNQVFGKADGPLIQSATLAYSLNTTDPSFGDDLVWEFYINKNIKLEPPFIKTVGPAIGDIGASLILPIESTFDGVMMSSSLKPGNNYADGQCGCSNNEQCDIAGGEICESAIGKCVNQTGPQIFCTQDSECSTDQPCINKKYISLVDKSTNPVGWWIGKENLDTVIPLDGYADQTKALINHTRFNIKTNYGAEFGSGVKDVYQNCYLPSEGPDASGVSGAQCEVTTAEPYCCNGTALDQAGWEVSSCFTGY